MNDIPHIDGVIIGEYVDDIAILITANTLEEAFNRAQIAITELEIWSTTWCLKFNTNKKKRINAKLQNSKTPKLLNSQTPKL